MTTYTDRKLDADFYATPGFYFFFIPIRVPYKKLYGMADQAGVKEKEAFGPILESGKMFGRGWIGIEIEKPAKSIEGVRHVSGEFKVYVHVGPFKKLCDSYKKIKKDHPGAELVFNRYLDDPEKTKPENLRTEILFKVPR